VVDRAEIRRLREPYEHAAVADGQQIPVAELDKRWKFPGGPGSVEDEHGTVLSISDVFVLVEDRLVPEWVNFKLIRGLGDPIIIGRIEIRSDVPQCVKLALIADNRGREIRQSDLRAIEINSLVIDLMAVFSIHVDQSDPDVTVFRGGAPGTDGPGGTYTAARRFMERQRKGPGLRDITPELLERVAEVYRANIDHAPTEAVAKTFGVKSRMASTYVQRARAAGFLPPTKQGKKQA
jgi:hypothetical protein